MFISYTTHNGLKFCAHRTSAQAVAHLLGSLNGDYKDDFWAEDLDGDTRLCCNANSRLDFSMGVYESAHAAFINQISDLDPDAQPEALRQLAAAIEQGLNEQATATGAWAPDEQPAMTWQQRRVAGLEVRAKTVGLDKWESQELCELKAHLRGEG